MKRLAIVGGETHVSEITRLHGDAVDIVGACAQANNSVVDLAGVSVRNYANIEALLEKTEPDIVAIANENDMKFESIMKALKFGCDVVVDKPLCIKMEDQEELEAYILDHSERKLLNLLTLRGDSLWAGMRDIIEQGIIGIPAFIHVRMAVQLKPDNRPTWFLDVRRSGGLFLDLLIHGLDQVEWLTNAKICSLKANMGNLGNIENKNLRDHAAVYCELDNGSTAVVEGQRMMPSTKSQDYRALIVGTGGYADMSMDSNIIKVTNEGGAELSIVDLPPARSIVQDWLTGGNLVPQEASLRANRLALLATISCLEDRLLKLE